MLANRWAVVISAWMLLAVAAPAAPSRAGDERWVTLGQQTLNRSEGRAVIPVTRGGGQFARLRLVVAHGVVYVEAVRIIYDTGATESLRIGAEFEPGQSSAVYELAGYGRRIDAVEIFGETGLDHGGRALVRVQGEAHRAGRVRDGDAFADDLVRGVADGDVLVIDRQRVDLSHDQHILRAGENVGFLEGIRVRSRTAAVRVRSLLVVQDDGGTFEVPVEMRLPPGSATPTIALGGQRLREVVVFLEPSRGSRLASLELEGVRAGRGMTGREPDPVPDHWMLLGEGTGASRDVVRVGSEAGRFVAVALRVAGGNIVLARISIVYADGRRDAYPVDKEIPDGTFTPGIRLKGDGRIDHVELVYKAGDAQAVVEVYGEPRGS